MDCYWYLISNLIVQWGTIQQTTNILKIDLPYSYNTLYIPIACDCWNSTANGYSSVWIDNTGTKTLSSFKVCQWHTATTNNCVTWFTIGY